MVRGAGMALVDVVGKQTRFESSGAESSLSSSEAKMVSAVPESAYSHVALAVSTPGTVPVPVSDTVPTLAPSATRGT